MSYRMSPLTLVLVCCVASLSASAEESFSRLEDKVIKILESKYNGVELDQDSNYSDMTRFTRNTREFIIYRLNKVGDWQKPMTVEGPDRSGISVRFRVSRGKWNGALVVPYSGTTDLNVFKETHVIRNSQDGKWHIWAEILTPKIDPPGNVKRKLVQVFNDFEKYGNNNNQNSIQK